MRALFFLLIGLYSLMVSAVPAKRERCSLTLADGSVVEATFMGDESIHFYMTDDSLCLQCDDKGIAHFVDAEALYARWQLKANKRQAARTAKRAARRKALGDESGTIIGNKPGLVILVQFPDVPFHYGNATFQRFFNEEGYTDGINIGSVRDYFLDASYGLFDFQFDVVGPITMSHSLSYYGKNNSNGDDQHPAEMAAEAVKMVDNEVDFSRYDWDGDGEVEQVFIIHSGYDEAQSRNKDQIWSHAWTLTEALEEGDGDGPVTLDDVVIDSYATSSELRNSSGTGICGIGTPCHEFTHCFGIPDFYDTVGYSFGMKSWDLMDYGEYNGNGGTPAGFTSYERMFCGWLNPTELTEATIVSEMPPLTSKPVAYILRNSGNRNEYYLFENRQDESWDKYLAGHGMLILHVDFDSQAWYDNTVNTVRSHQRMTIIPADNSLYSFSLSGDPWPGTSGNTELSDFSTPAATLYNENAEGDLFMHHSITGITESEEGLISFIFDEEALNLKDPKALQDSQKPIFDLSGRQIVNRKLSNCQIPSGIYIQDGKKIMQQ